eukprot:m.10815 g.10815  ORF g.10815 m.10815 type:complete len:397 (+) comp4323_c0_seq1:100-1290(+)
MAATIMRRLCVNSLRSNARAMSSKKQVEAFPYCGSDKPDFRRVDSSNVEICPPPSDMPTFTLRNGETMPAIGMGTFTGTRNTARAEAGTMFETTRMWLRLGGRAIDAASNYLNEDEIGDAMEVCFNDGFVTRDELFVSSKLNNPYHRPEHVRPMLEKTLLDLKLDQLDMFLLHWPTAFVHVPCDLTKRGFPPDYEPDTCKNVTGVEWDVAKFQQDWPPPHLDMGVSIHDTYEAMVECHKAGLTKGVGVCNFTVPLLHELLKGTDMIPHIVQCEGHPYCQQKGLLKYCQLNGIQFQAYSPLGYGLMAKDDEPTVLKNPEIEKIGKKYGKSIAATVLRWHVQRGVPVPPFSLNENELRENLLVGSWALDQEDMDKIATLDKAYHYLRPDEWYGLPYWD